MYATEYPSLVQRVSVLIERSSPAVEFPATAVPHDDTQVRSAEAERARDTRGHCWDGRPCDHPDHGQSGGPVHLVR